MEFEHEYGSDKRKKKKCMEGNKQSRGLSQKFSY
jgi:hypothetical protein